ncbi:MAG: hypothetical protein M3O46_14975, partial [Myxococcota bacterium]|nr:hypothetical protein [Myxococcota bacterium]
NHDSACITDCTNAACAGCLDPGASAMCQTSVRTGACQAFYGSPCLSTALTGAGIACDPSKYTNFGAWLQGVGNQYCR